MTTTLSSTLLAYQAAVLKSAQTEIEIREWIDGDTVYRIIDGAYTATLAKHDGYPWSDRVTGHGSTAARAQDDLIMNVLPDWYA